MFHFNDLTPNGGVFNHRFARRLKSNFSLKKTKKKKNSIPKETMNKKCLYV